MLGRLELELRDAEFDFEGEKFIDMREEYSDSYASFYISDGQEQYKCEFSIIFFIKEDGEGIGNEHAENM